LDRLPGGEKTKTKARNSKTSHIAKKRKWTQKKGSVCHFKLTQSRHLTRSMLKKTKSELLENRTRKIKKQKLMTEENGSGGEGGTRRILPNLRNMRRHTYREPNMASGKRERKKKKKRGSNLQTNLI